MQETAKRPSQKDYVEAAELREALRTFQHRSDEIATAHGLTARTYQLLLMIKTARDGSGRIGLTELEERLKLGKSTVTELVLRSERRGLVRRSLDPDRRRGIQITLTPAGERRLASAVAELGDERRRLVRVLSKQSS
jgi:DNA-binding MarR family transcriptional regulator